MEMTLMSSGVEWESEGGIEKKKKIIPLEES